MRLTDSCEAGRTAVFENPSGVPMGGKLVVRARTGDGMAAGVVLVR